MNNKIIIINIKAFTFIELIISISILAILSILGFISYSSNLEDSRDSQRLSDITYLQNSLKLHKTKRGNYPTPGESYNIVNSGTLAAIQGKMDNSVVISTVDEIPMDPFANIPYVYSVWRNNGEFQLAATYENNGVYKSLLRGDYKVVSKNELPTIVLAIYGTGNIEVNKSSFSGTLNRRAFVYDNTTHNIPYTFYSPFLPYSDNTSFTGLLNDQHIVWEQDNDYENCNEIYNGDKNIGTGIYQVNNFGILENVQCGTSLLPKNCREIKKANSGATDGNYTIMPDGITRELSVYCDMTTSSGGWTLVAKDGTSFIYTIGHCNFMEPPSNLLETQFVYWACDLEQSEMLFKTDSGWVIGINRDKEDCSTRATKVNNNTCTWTGSGKTFDILKKGGCMSGILNLTNSWLWWKGGNWEPTVTKNLSGLQTPLTGLCNSATGSADTTYCSLFDIYDSVGDGIGQGWLSYRKSNCTGGLDNVDSNPSAERHFIFVR